MGHEWHLVLSLYDRIYHHLFRKCPAPWHYQSTHFFVWASLFADCFFVVLARPVCLIERLTEALFDWLVEFEFCTCYSLFFSPPWPLLLVVRESWWGWVLPPVAAVFTLCKLPLLSTLIGDFLPTLLLWLAEPPPRLPPVLIFLFSTRETVLLFEFVGWSPWF